MPERDKNKFNTEVNVAHTVGYIIATEINHNDQVNAVIRTNI